MANRNARRTPGWLMLTFITVMCLLFAPLSSPAVLADGEDESLRQEADRLTYEILELRTRRRKASEERASILQQLARLDNEIAGADEEMEELEAELTACQQAYDTSVRALYMQGEVNELEIILESREFEEMYEDITLYQSLMCSQGEAIEALRGKSRELAIRRRDLREAREKRERLAETLDIDLLDSRIAELERRLGEINGLLRSMHAGGDAPGGPGGGDPTAWTPPPPGTLLERVPEMPPLSDFERTGMTYAGYTTSYGADFHGTPTASGVIFNMYDYTCAHKTLPFGTWLLVSFRGSYVIVQVNDRGPFVPGRVLDLSEGAAQSVGLDGVQWTEFEILIPRGG